MMLWHFITENKENILEHSSVEVTIRNDPGRLRMSIEQGSEESLFLSRIPTPVDMEYEGKLKTLSGI